MKTILNDAEMYYVKDEVLNERIKNNQIVILRGKRKQVAVGKGLSLKVNCSVGISDFDDYILECEKVKKISEFSSLPDIMMDLSIIPQIKPIYKVIQEHIGCPVGTVPVYTCFSDRNGINRNQLLEEIERQAESGVAFMTLHFTAIDELLHMTNDRNIKLISRGGSLVLRDFYLNKRKQNILLENFDEICKILNKYSVVLSIGTTFRPSTLYDALDEVQLKEIEIQKTLIKSLRRKGIKVMMEGVGHISMKRIDQYVELIRDEFYVPFMPLGPIVTDRAIGWDHITTAIGASHMANIGGADIINAVTREEHTGGVPNIDSIFEAIKTANVVVNTVDDVKFFEYYNKPKKEALFNCIGNENNKNHVGCDRCKNECPFILIKERMF